MPRRLGAGGYMSLRIAERMGRDRFVVTLELAFKLGELASQLGVGGQELAPLHERNARRRGSSTARGLFKIVAAMIAPYSVKANGGKRGSRCFCVPVAKCDRFSASTAYFTHAGPPVHRMPGQQFTHAGPRGSVHERS
jgi:hypothetical protein